MAKFSEEKGEIFERAVKRKSEWVLQNYKERQK